MQRLPHHQNIRNLLARCHKPKGTALLMRLPQHQNIKNLLASCHKPKGTAPR
jgi:hypothetical protein